MAYHRSLVLIGPLLAALLGMAPLRAQHDHAGARTGAAALRLGSVHMANSGAAGAQAAFRQGLAALHSFEYDLAAGAFRKAQRIDPAFALAFWGEAMTHNHPVWNQQQPDSARAILARYAPTREARRARAPTPRERDWLETVEVLYGDGSKARRDTLYLRAVEQLADRYPDDVEGQAFLSLAWLGLNQGVRSIPDYMRAGAIALPVLHRHPDHPGAAHYVIHAFDDPEHAPLGLPAAHAYSRIAPDAPHAQHMTTHIFLALGMWEENVTQNRVAVGSQPWTAGHYSWWWHYGLTQLGRVREATALRDSMRVLAGDRVTFVLQTVEAHHAIELDRWDDAVFDRPAPDAVSPGARLRWIGVQGLAAFRRGNAATLDRHVAEFETLAAGTAAAPDEAADRAVWQHLLLAARDAAHGRRTDAIAHAQVAARLTDTLPVDFGPPRFVWPPYELLGELLAASGNAAEAQRAWQRALQLAPGRSRALVGLIRAARAAGDHAVADAALERLRANWRHADSADEVLASLGRPAR